MRLSIILPTYKEPFLNKTIQSLLDGAVGEIEIIPVIDNCPLEEPIIVDPRVKPIFHTKNTGMRGAINSGLLAATGEWIMKMDSHCVIEKGYDQKLTLEENWLVIPRRYPLNEEAWDRDPKGKIKDYHYLTFPGKDDPRYGYSFQVQPYKKEGPEIDDTLTFQGSCWVANRKYFMEHVGFLETEKYGSFAQEQQEVGLKYWLGGGAVKVNKNVWYAHLFKKGRHYESAKFSNRHKKGPEQVNGNEYSTMHWMSQPGFPDLIAKFMPLPNWPENWQEVYQNEKPSHFC